MLRIIFDSKQKRFIASEGARIFFPKFIWANGWNCRINFDGSVECIAAETRNGKYFETCFKINRRGLASIKKLKGDDRSKDVAYRIRDWPIDGIIILTTEKDIEKREAFFRNIDHL